MMAADSDCSRRNIEQIASPVLFRTLTPVRLEFFAQARHANESR